LIFCYADIFIFPNPLWNNPNNDDGFWNLQVLGYYCLRILAFIGGVYGIVELWLKLDRTIQKKPD
jgi:hypothetical protein